MTSVASKYFQSVDKNEDNFKSNNFPIVISKSKVFHDRYFHYTVCNRTLIAINLNFTRPVLEAGRGRLRKCI